MDLGSRTTCLRCDWEGDARSSVCPSCGTSPLYRAPKREHPAAAPPPPATAGAAESAPPGAGAAQRRSAGTWPTIAVAALIALVALVSARTLHPADQPAAAPLSHPDRFIPPRLARANAIPVRGYAAHRRHLTVDGIRFSFDVPTQGWQSYGSISVSLTRLRYEAGSAIVFWSGFPDARTADPCVTSLHLPSEATSAQLFDAIRHAAGVKVLKTTTDAVVGGRPARAIELRVLHDAGCDPGFFFSWRDGGQGSLWPGTTVGDTIRIWLVDVGGDRHLVVEAETTKGSGPELEREVEQIVSSMRFA